MGNLILIRENKRKIFIPLVFVFLFLISLTSVSASEFGYNYLEGQTVNTGGNYTINVNNTDYFQGYTPNDFRFITNNTFNNLFLGTSDLNHSIYFYDLGSPSGNYLRWDDDSDRFELSTEIYIDGEIITSSNLEASGLIDAHYGRFDWVDKLEQVSEPDTPPANTLRLFVEEESGFSRYKYKDEYGVVRTLNDDEIIVKNIKGSTIAKHRIVYANGSDGGIPTVDLADASNISRMPSICVTIEQILNGDVGRCMQTGLLQNVNTNAYNVGTIYVSDTTAGIPTNTPPLTPNLTQEIGTILVKSATIGQIQIISRALTGDEFGTINNFEVIGNLSSGGSDFFVDTDNGRVGIGTSSPTTELEVVGDITIGDIKISQSTATLAEVFFATDDAFRAKQDSSFGTQMLLVGSTYATDPGRVVFRYGAGGTRFEYTNDVDANIEMMRITSSGNVGIGTPSPFEKLHVDGSILVNETLLVVNNITTENYLVVSNGTVGVTHWHNYEDGNGTLVWEKL